MRYNDFKVEKISTFRNWAKHLVLHECGLFFDQELDHFLFKCLSLMIISINPSTELHSPLLRLQELFRLPVFPGLELLHHGLSLGHEFLAGLALSHLVLSIELVAVLLQVLLDVKLKNV